MTLEGKQVDRYHILHLLGSGGMGDVYLAEDPRIGQQVAIKVIRTEVAPYPDENNAKDAARLFHREAKAIVRLDHPYILPLFDYGEERIGNMSIIYLVMPYRPEGSLSDWLRKRETKQLLSPRDIAHFVAQAASALQHAHDHNVIHQDVKPSNFLVRISIDTSPLPDLLLSDFGIARLSSATSSVSQSVRGTPSYMAPEQWEGEPVPSTDQYALAVMAYELLTGKLPFQGGPGKMMYQHIHVQPQPTSALNPGLTGEIDKVVARALAKRPQERFDSMSEFGIAFQQAVGSVSKVQSGSLLNQIEKPGVALTPIASDDAEGNTPTLLNSAMPDVGSDSETFVKIEHSSTSTLKPPRKRKLTVVALIMLVVALIGGGVAYAVSSVTAASSGGHLGLTTLTPNRSPVVTNATSASISIVPATKTLQNPFSIDAVTGAPDQSKTQFQGARILTTTTSTYMQTAQATGQGTIPGTQASGTVCIDNFNTAAPLTLQAGSIYGNTYPGSPFFHMILNTTESLPPAPSSSTWSQVCGPAHVQEVGTIGNNIFNNNQNGSINFSVFTNSALKFTNGKDPQNYVAVQQSDITNAENALINANTPNAQQVLQPQLRSNEQFVGASQCNPNASSNHQTGDNATSVTVSVNFTCTGEVYNHDGALALASQLLAHQAASEFGSNIASIGSITTSVTSAKITDTQQGTVTIVVDAQGKWVYQFTTTQKQAWTQLIAGKKKDAAQSLLLEQTGIAQATFQLTGGDGVTLPTDSSKITIVVSSATG